MIFSSIASIVGTFQIFQYIKPTVLTQIKVRFKHTILDSGFIEQKLGLPIKPKKPVAPFFRYMIEIRPSVVTQHPALSTKQHVKLISEMWNSLDATKKEKYSAAFQNECIGYNELLAKYNEQLTDDDKRLLKLKRKVLQEEIEKRKFVRSQRKKADALNRPKRPVSAYFKYLESQDDRQPNEKYYDYLRRKSAEFKGLSESEKDAYRVPAADLQTYQNKLLKWKGKMIKSGNYDVIRSEIPNFLNFDDVLNLKKANLEKAKSDSGSHSLNTIEVL